MFCAVQKLAGLDYVSAFIRILCCDNGRGRRIADDCFGDLLIQTALSRVVVSIARLRQDDRVLHDCLRQDPVRHIVGIFGHCSVHKIAELAEPGLLVVFLSGHDKAALHVDRFVFQTERCVCIPELRTIFICHCELVANIITIITDKRSVGICTLRNVSCCIIGICSKVSAAVCDRCHTSENIIGVVCRDRSGRLTRRRSCAGSICGQDSGVFLLRQISITVICIFCCIIRRKTVTIALFPDHISVSVMIVFCTGSFDTVPECLRADNILFAAVQRIADLNCGIRIRLIGFRKQQTVGTVICVRCAIFRIGRDAVCLRAPTCRGIAFTVIFGGSNSRERLGLRSRRKIFNFLLYRLLSSIVSIISFLKHSRSIAIFDGNGKMLEIECRGRYGTICF